MQFLGDGFLSQPQVILQSLDIQIQQGQSEIKSQALERRSSLAYIVHFHSLTGIITEVQINRYAMDLGRERERVRDELFRFYFTFSSFSPSAKS